MFHQIDTSLIDWSRAQFALTAMYHWLFVPLTLGLSFIIAIMETYYVRTGDQKWKNITKFWMKLFGINFAIGVATGLILEFEFGTNWSSYSWFVGDIFGAPLAIEGMMAFFMETTFIAVMFFGWEKVSKRFHLTATWLTAIGSNLSAVWILVANAWMQDPKGMQFNPDTARNEMVDFWEIIFSNTALNKFFHTVLSSYMLAAVFVIGISAWYLLQHRKTDLALKSSKIAAVFGFCAVLLTIFTGDTSARGIAKTQPMKFAAIEALYTGHSEVELNIIGILNQPKITNKGIQFPTFKGLKIPRLLSYMTSGDGDAYIPGINDLLQGNETYNILPLAEKIRRGRIAQQALLSYKKAVQAGDTTATLLRAKFEDEAWMQQHFSYFGYGSYYNEDPQIQLKNSMQVIPPLSLTFYSFHVMVLLGFWFLLLFSLVLFFHKRKTLQHKRYFLWILFLSIPLAYVASEAGWIVSEVGRQPWIIQDLMTNAQAVTRIDSDSVKLTFVLFAITFTTLLIAEIGIMVKQIKNKDLHNE